MSGRPVYLPAFGDKADMGRPHCSPLPWSHVLFVWSGLGRGAQSDSERFFMPHSHHVNADDFSITRLIWINAGSPRAV